MIGQKEIRAVLVGRGFVDDGLKREHAESLTLPGRETFKLKRSNRFPLVIHPRHDSMWNDLLSIPGVLASPDRFAHNSNFFGFPKRLHTGYREIAYGLDFGFESTTALEGFLEVLLQEGRDRPVVLDSDAQAFLDSFMAADNAHFVDWLPRYRDTLARVADALARDASEELFELIWKSRDNAVSNAGQGVMGFKAADRLREKLVDVIRDIAADGGEFNSEVHRV